MTRQMATRVECEREDDQQLQDNILSQIERSLAMKYSLWLLERAVKTHFFVGSGRRRRQA